MKALEHREKDPWTGVGNRSVSTMDGWGIARRSAPAILCHLAGSVLCMLLIASLASNARCAEPLPGSSEESPSVAAEPRPTVDPPNPDAEPLRYRAVFVPPGREEQWPPGNRRYRTMSAREFHEKVTAVNTASSLGGGSYGATIRSAKYRARLEDDTLVDGHASLDVGCSVPSPTTLSLQPCGLAIGDASWADKDDETARLGLGPEEQLQVWLDGPGKLEFDWSLRGRSDSRRGLVFSLAFPRGPATQLTLELPDNRKPICSRGVVIQAGPEEEAAEDGFQWWRIELGGHHLAELRLVSVDEADRRNRLPRVRQTTTYRLSSDVARVDVELVIDVRHEPLRRITLTLDPSVRIVSAELGGKPLDWSVVSALDQDGSSRVALEPAEPIEGSSRRISISALAPVDLDGVWRLPRIRPEPGDVAWNQAEATIQVIRPLVVEQLDLIDARQTSVRSTEPGVGVAADETFELQYSSPDATVQIALARREALVEVDTAVAVSLGGGKLTAETKADLRVADGQHFVLGAEVSKQWRIDSLTTEPADILSDWDVRQDVEERRILTVRLARPLTVDQPVLLTVVARQLRSPLGRALRGSDLAPLKFLDTRRRSRLIALGDVTPYQWDISNDDNLVRHDPRTHESTALQRLTKAPRGLVFEENEAAGDLRVSLVSRSPNYSAKVEVQAIVSGNSLLEQYYFECEPPQGSRIDRVLVRFSQDRDSELDWRLGPEDEAVPAQREGEEAGVPDRRLWEIRLDQPRSAKFDFRASRQSDLTDGQAVCLAGLPQSLQQQATLEIWTTGSSVVVVDNKRLRPIPLEKPPFSRYSSVRSAFRYQVEHDMDPADAPLTISPGPAEPVGPSAWAWSCRLDSRCEASGLTRHMVSYRIESTGREQLECTLPPQTAPVGDCEAWINDVAIEAPSVDKDNRLSINLPSGERFVEVRVAFSTRGRPLGWIRPVGYPQFGVDIPVLARSWTVWLPPGFKASRETTEQAARGVRRLSPMERLFGPLGRGVGEKQWDPFLLDTWLLTFGGQDPHDNARRKALRLLELMGELSSAANGGEFTWGKLLGDKRIQRMLDDTSNDQSTVALLVDQESLNRAGPTADTPVRRTAAMSGAAEGLAMLRDANLSMLIGTDAIVLTSASEAAAVREQLTPLTDETLNRTDHQASSEQPADSRLSSPPDAAATPGEASLDPNETQREATNAGSLNLVWQIDSGPLADELQRSARDEWTGAFTLATRWSTRPAPGATPWRNACPVGYRPDDVFGWTAYPLEASSSSPVELVVLREDMLRCLRWITMLVVVWFAWWKLLERPAVLAAILGAFAVAAMLAPEPYAVVLSGGVLGSLASLVLRWITPIRRQTHRAAASGSSPSRSRRAVGTAILLLAIGLLLLSAGARAQEASEETQIPPADPVFIPADENGQATGEDYRVTTSFHDTLLRRAAALTNEPRDWMLSRATYRGTLSWQRGPMDRLVLLGPFTATFDLEVLTAGVTVRIPLGGYSSDNIAARLDGQTIQPLWNEEQGVVEFVAEQTGWSRLEISLEPTMAPEGTSSGFDLVVPRLATSQLELILPADAPAVDIPQAIGAVVLSEDSTRLSARLGPLNRNRLEIRWPSGATQGSTSAVPNVEELLWLTVQPGSAILDAKFKFRIRDTAVRTLSVAVDPTLQRLGPFLCDQVEFSLDQEDSLAANQSRTVHLNLTHPVSNEELIVQARFVVKGCSGVGSLPAPLLETRNMRVASRWLAVSIDPSLECDYSSLSSPETMDLVLDAMDFVDAWGADADAPSFARELSEKEPTWRLDTRPRDPVATARQALTLDYDARGADVQFDAQVNTTLGARFQYRILAPPEFEVEDEAHCVSVTAVHSTDLDERIPDDSVGENSPGGGNSAAPVFDDQTNVAPTELVRRCSRAEDGSITVFLKSPVQGPHVVSLRGRLPLSGAPQAMRRVDLPTFEIENTPRTSSTIQIFRQPRIRLGVDSLNGLSEADVPSTPETFAGRGRLVATLAQIEEGPIGASLTIEKNRPTIHGDRTTVLAKTETWEATVEFDLQVDRGVVDEMILVAPPWWKPREAPAAEVSGIAASEGDESYGRYRIRPRTAIEGPYRLAVSGPLELAPDGAVQVPDATLEGVTLGKSILVLPTSLDLEPTPSARVQARKVDVPERFSQGEPGAATEVAAWELAGRSYRAVARPNETQARVSLADARITFGKGGTCRGVITFDLDAAGRLDCLLRVPEGLHIARIDAPDATTMPMPQGPGVWKIPLGWGSLPKRIEVVFWGRTPPADAKGRRRVASPWLEEIPVEQTLWTLSTGAGNPRPQDAQLVEQDALALDRIRLRSVAKRIEDTQGLADAYPAEVAAWYRQWVRYWTAARHEVQASLADAQAHGRQDAATAELEQLELSQTQLAQAMEAEEIFAAASKEKPSGRGMMEFQLSTPDRHRHTVYYAIGGAVDSIRLAPERPEFAGAYNRELIAAALACLTLVTVFFSRRGDCSAWLRRWPHLIGVVVGLAWWIWLSPSFAGFALAMASFLASFRSPWKRRQRSSSAIVPLGVLDR